MLSEHESSNSAGGEESEWVDEVCEGEEEFCDRSWKSDTGSALPAAAVHWAVPVEEQSAEAGSAAKPRRSKTGGTRHASSAGAERKKYAAANAPAASWGHPRRSDALGRGPLLRSRRMNQQLHEFRCKGFTFEWRGDVAADVPAYDLSPSFKLLRLSLDARVDDAPADILRGFFRTFEAAGEAARSDLAAGACLTFHVDKGEGAAAPSKAAAAAASEASDKGKWGHNQSREPKQQALAASYFAPLGDELYVGRSPQHLQLLSPNRFIGTIRVTAASPSAAAAAAAAESQAASANTAAAEGDASAGPGRHTRWEEESSFPTWHRIRVIGAAASTPASATAGDAESAATPAAKEEPAAFSASAKDEPHGRKKKKKKAKSRQRDEWEMYGDNVSE